jgi:hypothetical protein
LLPAQTQPDGLSSSLSIDELDAKVGGYPVMLVELNPAQILSQLQGKEERRRLRAGLSP